MLLLPRGHQTEALFRRSKVKRGFESRRRKKIALVLSLSFSLSSFSQPRTKKLKKKKLKKKKTHSADDPDLLPLRSAFARVVAPLAAALCLCNADRICLAVAIVPMAAELGWKPATQGEC